MDNSSCDFSNSNWSGHMTIKPDGRDKTSARGCPEVTEKLLGKGHLGGQGRQQLTWCLRQAAKPWNPLSGCAFAGAESMHRGYALLWCAWLPPFPSHPVEEVVGVWTEPPGQVPGKGAIRRGWTVRVPDGPLIGNGQLGGAFGWHASEDALEVDLYLGHNGFFAAPIAGASSCGYSPGGRKALAGLTLKFAGSPSVLVARQLAANGTVQLQLSRSQSRELTLSAFIHALQDVVLLELSDADVNEEVEVTLWTFSGCHGPPRPPVSPGTRVPEGGPPVSKTTGPTSDRLPSQMVAGPQALQVMRGNGWPFQAAHFPVQWFGLTGSIRNEAVEKGQFHEVEAMGRCGPETFLRGPCARGTWRPQQEWLDWARLHGARVPPIGTPLGPKEAVGTAARGLMQGDLPGRAAPPRSPET
eukprot:s223_g25.t1